MKQGTILGSQIGRWILLAALVVALGALLLTIRPVEAQTDTIPVEEKYVTYEENGERPVDTFNSTGLQARKVFWYLEGTDAGKFKLGEFTGRSTTLEFRSSPNYEDPQDAAQTADATATPPLEADAATNNRYQVTVRAGDGGANKSKIFQVTVEVTNAKEQGKISLTPIQPQVTRQMTAALTDPDKVDPDARNYSWTSSDSMNGSYTPIPGAENKPTYTPRPTDVGRYIRVKATYRDGATRDEEIAMAEATSDYPVEAQPFPNVAPEFPDQDPGGTTGTTADLATTRTVDEGLPAGTKVGPPVTAVDHDGDVLTYSLWDGDVNPSDAAFDPTLAGNTDGDSTKFAINPKTGQITTKARLDFEETTAGANQCATPNACSVIVAATDPSGLPAALPQLSPGATAATNPNVLVTINIAAVDEPPGTIADTASDFTTGDVAPAIPVNTDEYQDRAEYVSATEGTQGGAAGTTLATYVTTPAADPDGTTLGALTWRVAGPDGSDFIIGPNGGDGSTGELRFKENPNYDKPADENEDNVYELIVVASDPQLNVSTLWVTIKVTDLQEPGSVSFNKRHPAVGEAITATLKDPDGVSGNISWQWHKGAADTFTPDDTNKISTATSATYTPLAADVGEFLKAVATYSDKQAPGTEQTTGDVADEVANTSNVTTIAVLAIPESPGNRDSEFTAATRKYYVAETLPQGTIVQNTVAATAVGATADNAANIAATDADATQTPTYYVRDRTAQANCAPVASFNKSEYFQIIGSLDLPDGADQGQLQTRKKLDFEDPARGSYPGRVTYHLCVGATDPFGSTAEVPVTVVVTDRAENPVIENPPSGSPVSVMVHDEVVSAPMAVAFYENGTGTVADFTAKDPDGDSIAWSVVGVTQPTTGDTADLSRSDTTSVDSDLFEINSLTGVLTFKSSPSYEDKQDTVDTATGSASVTDNIYQVTIRARSLDTAPTGGSTAERDANQKYNLKVKVLNVPENPVFRISSSSRSREEDHGSADDVTRGPNRPIGEAPVTAIDPDSTDHDVATLTYTLEGSDAASFEIVPATGQLLTKDVLDYETKSKYSVVVKATDPNETDPSKADDTINIGIEVLDVIEIAPVGLTVEGQPRVNYAENDTASLGEYTAVGDTAANVTWNPLKGDDAEYFILEGSGSTQTLKFRASPNYEMPRGEPVSANNTNTYRLTVEIRHTTTATTASLPVEVTVTNVDELGTLTGQASFSYAENGTESLGEYTVDGTMMDAAVWSLSGHDADDFNTNGSGSSFVLAFANSPNFEMPMGGVNGDSNTYMVTVMVTAGGEERMQEVAVSVTDVDDPGKLTLQKDGADAAGAVLMVGDVVTATVEDEDGSVEVTAWQWSKSTTMDGTFTDITGATSMSYTTVEADAGYYLKATANYLDAYRNPNMVYAMTGMVTAAPMFAADTATREVAENTVAGTAIGDPVTATDTPGDILTYALGGTDAASFGINGSSGQIMTNAALDYETKSSYSVTVTASDGTNSSSIAVTITVTDVDEGGMVTLSATTAMVGDTLTASYSDPDGGVNVTAWSWGRGDNPDLNNFSAISGATSDSYTTVDADGGMYVAAWVTYNDKHGMDKRQVSAAVMVSVDIVSSYDTNGTDGIQIDELLIAISDHFGSGLSIDDLLDLIDAYFASSSN